MRKNVFGRQLKRDRNERTALFKGLISALVLHERIKTTEDKAKAIKADVDKIITKAKSDLAKAKKGETAGGNLLQGKLTKKEIEKVILEIAPRFKDRQGGYTRIVRIGRRFSDNAQMVLMEWTVTKIKYQKSNIKNDIKELSAGKVEEKSKTEKEAIKSKTNRKVTKK